MSFTIDQPDVGAIGTPRPNAPDELKFAPDKVFTGYDPKGTLSITNEPLKQNVKQEATSEGNQAETPAPPKEESLSLSPKISALARKEQAQRAREVELQRRERELSAKLADAEKFSQMKAKIAAKDYSSAEELGMSHEEYTKYLLEKQSKEDPADKRYRELEDRLQSLQKQQEEREIKEYETNQGLWKKEISKLVTDNPAFSTIKELGAEEAVLRHINDSFEEDGLELSAEDAAKEIEEALVSRAEKFASVTKLKEKFGSKPAKLGPPKTPQTITQNMTVTSTKPVSKPFHLMSESEQIAEAMRRVQEAKLAR